MEKSILDKLRIGDTTKDEISVEEIFSNFDTTEKFSIYLFALGALNAVPIPMPPGYSSIFGTLIMILSLQMIRNKKSPMLPRFITKKTFKKSKVLSILDKARPTIQKLEKIIKRNETTFFDSYSQLIGAYFFICGLVLFTPIPFGNIFSGLAISISALALIEKNIRFFLIGGFLMILASVFTFLIAYAGVKTLLIGLSQTI